MARAAVCSARCFKTFEPGYEIFEPGYEIFEPGYEFYTPVLNIGSHLRNYQPPVQILKPACENCKISYRPTKLMRRDFKPGFQISWLPAKGFDVVIRANDCFVFCHVRGPGFQGRIYLFLAKEGHGGPDPEEILREGGGVKAQLL